MHHSGLMKAVSNLIFFCQLQIKLMVLPQLLQVSQLRAATPILPF